MFKKIEISNINISEFEEVYISEFPTNYLYDKYDRILIRVLNLREVQDYSTYDVDNYFKFRFKIDEILEKCVLFYKADIDSYIHYSHIYESDKLWLLYTIREKTFPSGFILEAEIEKNTIKILRQNIDLWQLDKQIIKCYNSEFFCIHTFKILPPTIGLQRCFDLYETNNLSFKKYAIYLKPNIIFMNKKEIRDFELWFETITNYDFFILKDFIDNYFKIGIKGVKNYIFDHKSIQEIKEKTFSLFQMPLEYILRNRIQLVSRGFSDRDMDGWEYWRFQSNINLITSIQEEQNNKTNLSIDTDL